MRDSTLYEEPIRKYSTSDEELELFHGYEIDYDEIISERNNQRHLKNCRCTSCNYFREVVDEFDIDNYIDEENVLFEEDLFDESQSSSSKLSRKIRQQRNYQKHLADAIHKINKYIVVKNGHRQFVLPKENLATLATRLRINPKLLKVLLKSMKPNNLNRKYLRPIQAELELKNSSCPGKSGVTFHWWGNKTYLNNCETLTLIDVMQYAGGATAACAAIYPPCGILAGVAGVTATWINFINREGGNRGIVCKTVTGMPIPAIWHQ